MICKLVYACSHICLGPNKKELITSRLGRYIKHRGFDSYSAYISFLEESDSDDEKNRLIDCITTNHTFFLREPAHFEFLSEEIVPSFLKNNGHRDLKIWSAACATGEEPYSLAITLTELVERKPFSWSIHASDISEAALSEAMEGVYREERLKEMDNSLKEKYFFQGVDAWSGYFRIRDDLRKNVHFVRSNLLDTSSFSDKSFDVIFCRNVMIYFDDQTQEALVSNLVKRLNSGGFLIVGHAENLNGIRHPLKSHRSSIYQKK